jgi:hypothetical protein
LVQFKIGIITAAWRQRNQFDDFEQIYFIFARYRFCKFQKIFDEIKVKELLKEGSKVADINEGKFILNIDALFAFNIL